MEAISGRTVTLRLSEAEAQALRAGLLRVAPADDSASELALRLRDIETALDALGLGNVPDDPLDIYVRNGDTTWGQQRG